MVLAVFSCFRQAAVAAAGRKRRYKRNYVFTMLCKLHVADLRALSIRTKPKRTILPKKRPVQLIPSLRRFQRPHSTYSTYPTNFRPVDTK